MKPRQLALLVSTLSLFALVVSPFASPALATPNLTFTVNASTDVVDFLPGDGVCETQLHNGMCTLRAAIMEANARIGADTITLPSTTYQLSITGVNEDQAAAGDLDITESLTINAAGAETPVIDAEGLGDRALDISSTAAEVTLNRVIIQNGSTTGNGGGIENSTHLTLISSGLYTNHADGNGGGIYSTGPLNLQSVNVFLNFAGDDGGGIFTYSDIDSHGASLTYNTAGGGGGALYLGNASHAQMSGSFFDDNEAVESGGAIFNNGELVMEGGTISDGEAGSSGGGIFTSIEASTTLADVSITENHAANYGGGIYNAAGSIFNGQDLVLEHNSSGITGGAMYSLGGEVYLNRSVLSSNTADSYGGAIANSSGPITIEASTIISNTASQGGGIANVSGTITVEASTIISNAASQEGGGIYNGGILSLIGVTLSENQAHLSGGAIANYLGLTVENSTISHNRAKEDGGGVYNHSMASIYNSTITANIASSDFLNPGGDGGGVYAWGDSTTQLSNSIIAGNHHRQLTDLIDDDCYGVLYSGDYNLVGALTACSLNVPGHDLTGMDPLLGVLADNGGPTLTHALLGHSPAIDGGNPAGCLGEDGTRLATDQRGVNRHQDGDPIWGARCDIGAYEYPGEIYVYLPMTVR